MVAPDILSPFAVVLLDMNGTFMFREDRSGPDQDYAATYLLELLGRPGGDAGGVVPT